MEANTFLSDLTTGLVVALIPVLIGALGWVARTAVTYIKARTSASHYDLLRQLASAAVRASEQALKGRDGQTKLRAAKSVVTNALLARGIKLDEEAITAAIEASVWVEKGIFIDAEAATPVLADSIPAVDFSVTTSETGA
jgi:LL-H family phage holin